MMKALAYLYWGAIVLAVLSGPMIAVGAPGDLYVNSGFQPGNILRIAPDGTISNFTTGLDGPWGLAFDAAGILFESDNAGGIIYKFTKDGSRTTVGVLSNVTGLAIDASGNVYAADNSFGNIYRYAPDGTRTTFATGTGHPSHLAFDSSGNLFLTNSDFNVGTGTIVKISPNGEKSTFTTKLDAPSGLAFDRSGNLFVTEERGGTILRFTPNGSRTTFATGLNSPSGLAFDSSGNLFEIDMTANAFGGNGSINKFAPDGTKSTFATNFSLPESLAFEPGPETLLNISTRMRVLTGDNVLIGGFIITGADPKKVIIRGMGPSLTGVGVTLSDPTLELHQGSATLATNDNWKIDDQSGQSQEADIRATTIPPGDELEAAIVATLNPGTYTAILAGKAGGKGVGVVEVYDLAQSANSRVANISTRGFVDTGNDVMIGGFILSGGTSGGKVLVLALGPSVPVSGALGDPTLELHNGSGTTIATNDNWKINDQTGESQQSEIEATTIPPTNDLESALVVTLTPGNYTVIVQGKNNATGIGLVAVYNLQ